MKESRVLLPIYGPRTSILVNNRYVAPGVPCLDRRLLGVDNFFGAPKQATLACVTHDVGLDVAEAKETGLPAKLPAGGRPAFGVTSDGIVIQWYDPYAAGARVFEQYPLSESAVCVVPVGPVTQAQVEARDALVRLLRKAMPWLKEYHCDKAWSVDYTPAVPEPNPEPQPELPASVVSVSPIGMISSPASVTAAAPFLPSKKKPRR